MAIEIIEYFSSADKSNWIKQIERSDWEAGKYLSKLLSEDTLRDLCGASTELYLLTENGKIYSFCTLAEQDEIKAPEMTPWIGFVYTFPDYRGKGHASTLINYVCSVAKKNGHNEIYCSPSFSTTDLCLKLGFSVLDYPMITIYGYETNVLRKDI